MFSLQITELVHQGCEARVACDSNRVLSTKPPFTPLTPLSPPPFRPLVIDYAVLMPKARPMKRGSIVLITQ